jgi:hypothetical protein
MIKRLGQSAEFTGSVCWDSYTQVALSYGVGGGHYIRQRCGDASKGPHCQSNRQQWEGQRQATTAEPGYDRCLPISSEQAGEKKRQCRHPAQYQHHQNTESRNKAQEQ